MPPIKFPNWKPKTLFFYILIPVLTSAILISFLTVFVISESLVSHFERMAHGDLELASDLGIEVCEERFNDLLMMRLTNNPMMVAAMRREALNSVLTIAQRFSNIKMAVVDQNGRVESTTSYGLPEGLNITLPKLGNEEVLSLDLQGGDVLLRARYFPFWRWYVVSFIPREDVLEPLRRIQEAMLVSLSAILFTLIFTVLVTFNLAIKKPLNTLIDALKEISAGQFRRVENTRRDEIGLVTGAINSMSASLERQQQELEISVREKSVLLQEIHHRVKNNLNIVVSLLSLQAEQIKDSEEAKRALESSCSRIHAMALVHEKLYQSDTFSAIDIHSYLDSISGQLISIYGSGKDIKLCLDVEDTEMDLSIALPCGLIFNELCTNSLIHAFPDRRDGKISLSFRSLDDANWELFYSDDGTGIPGLSDSLEYPKTLGMTLIKVLSEQVSGKTRMRNNGGFEFYLRIPR